jgi:diguanylate cyclase (GGDEF)-like protein
MQASNPSPAIVAPASPQSTAQTPGSAATNAANTPNQGASTAADHPFPDWAKDSSDAAMPAPAAARAVPQAAPPTTIVRVTQILPPWLWLLVIALPILAYAWWRSQRKADRLEDETQRIARRERALQSAHRDLRTHSEYLRHLAINDPLTGVLNRQAFANELRELLDHLSRFRRPLNLMVFDLDHFKTINDRQGHLAGDAALKLVVGVVRKHLDSADLLGRFGGDEFLIACADRSLEETAAIAEAIRGDVVAEARRAEPVLENLSLSIGIAQANPESGYLVDALFHRADTALYAAKREGRNRVVLASEALPEPPANATVARNLA